MVIAAAAAEVAAVLASDGGWRTVADRNVRAGAVFALLAAGALVALTGHLGGLLVWGADFLRP
jgi:hypothetical protein